ncbi:UNVERIFIED_CONTAM: MGMT family protein [Halobacillus marinus]
MKPFTEKVLAIIQKIPEGSVSTYGQVARLAGNRRAARQVSRILHAMSDKYNLPWHRVVNRNGEIVLSGEERAHLQQLKLEAEGMTVIHGKVSLNTYQIQDEVVLSSLSDEEGWLDDV